MGEDGVVADAHGLPSLQYVWGKYWVNSHAHVLSGAGIATAEQLYIALSRRSISEYVTRAVQQELNQKNLKAIEMRRPSNALSFDTEFCPHRSNRQQADALQQLRDALLPKLMSGEIDVSKAELPLTSGLPLH